ncbi:hypothetical protein FACS1894147_11800 [Spirochaetia bacterium]|nr:hypothetical protein FACS1894147_11800 [Spirochaetia bacterium]
MVRIRVIALLAAAVIGLGIGACRKTTPVERGTEESSASSVSTAETIPPDAPDFVIAAVISEGEDALTGIGKAKLASRSQSMTFAQTRARMEIYRQLNRIIEEMVRDYAALHNTDPSDAAAFREAAVTALSTIPLTGSSVVEMDSDTDGAFWAVVSLSKTNAAAEIKEAAAAAKLAVPALAAFDTADWIDAAFNRVRNRND